MVLEEYVLTSSVVSISVYLRVIVQSLLLENAKTLNKVNEYYLSFKLYPIALTERDMLTVSRTCSII